jgi:hypothetical protein
MRKMKILMSQLYNKNKSLKMIKMIIKSAATLLCLMIKTNSIFYINKSNRKKNIIRTSMFLNLKITRDLINKMK